MKINDYCSRAANDGLNRCRLELGYAVLFSNHSWAKARFSDSSNEEVEACSNSMLFIFYFDLL